MNESESNSAAHLDYAPAPPHRRKWIRRIFFALLLIGLPLATWRYGPPVWWQTRILYYQRQGMNYTASPDQVIYEEDPAAASKLLAGDSQFRSYGITRNQARLSGINAAAFCPNCFNGISGWVVPTMLGPSPIGRGAVAFLHERVSPAGHRQLVYVIYYPPQYDFSRVFVAGYDYVAESIRPATLLSPPVRLMKGYGYSVKSNNPKEPPNVRMYAGQPDPSDPSHFTIRYEMWGQSDVLDGRLDDADHVTLKPRNPPQWR